MDNYFCTQCNGTGIVATDNVDTKLENADKEFICLGCNAQIKIGDAVINVSGHKSDEVKEVSSHLVKQFNDAQLELEKVNNKKLLQKELNNNSLKLFLIGGGFWLGLFGAVFYMIFSLAMAQINWYRFVGSIFVLPIFFTVVGAFILRTTSQISETNFINLVKLTLKLNFKGLKILSKQDSDDDFEPVQ